MSVTGIGEAGLTDLRGLVGADYARPATIGDAVDGVPARVVVAPGTVAEASAVLALAHRAGFNVVPRGGGTKIQWGATPTRVDLVVDMTRLDRVLEHAAGDLVVRVEAGALLEEAQRVVSGSEQMLALDPPTHGATIGGVIAANASGPRRLRYGTVRDLLIGVTVVLADGTVAKSGGKVVKNVAGYDLGKLFTGSLGTLGLIVEAIFRLHPRPAARRIVVVEVGDPGTAGAAVQALLHTPDSPLVLDALELTWEGDGGRIAAVFGGIEPGVEAQAATATRLLGAHGVVRVLDPATEERALTRFAYPWWDGETGLKIAHLPSDLPHVLSDALRLSRERGLTARIGGHAGNGITFVGLGAGDAVTIASTIDALRAGVGRRGGSLVALQAPREVKGMIDVWGPIGDALPLMRRVKERFDPTGIMNPGRFVGGL